MSGWVPLDAAWWPAIAEALPHPWPEEAALFDLRWHHDQGDPRGRAYFVRRWGWTDWRVKTVFRSTAWVDPIRRQPTASVPPGNRQPTASVPPESVRTNAERGATSASVPPADRQETASVPPADRQAPVPIRARVHPTPYTDTDRSSVEVVGVKPRPPWDEATPAVLELLALERDVTDDDPDGCVMSHRKTDRDALISSLTSGRSPEWHRRLVELAAARGWKRRRWRTLLTSEYLEDLRKQIVEAPTPAPAAQAEPWVLPPRRPSRIP